MKTLILLLALALAPAIHAATITFGSTDFEVDSELSASGWTQTDSTLTFSGDLSTGLYGYTTGANALAGIDFTSSTLSITGSTSDTTTSAFTVTFSDADGDSVSYSGFWSSLYSSEGSPMTATLTYNGITVGEDSDGTVGSITTISINGTGSISVTLNSLTFTSAVPEPAACAALAGAATLGAALFRRRRLGSRR